MNYDRRGLGGRTGVIAANIEMVFIGVAIADYAGSEVVAAWWSEGCIGGRVSGI